MLASPRSRAACCAAVSEAHSKGMPLPVPTPFEVMMVRLVGAWAVTAVAPVLAQVAGETTPVRLQEASQLAMFATVTWWVTLLKSRLLAVRLPVQSFG